MDGYITEFAVAVEGVGPDLATRPDGAMCFTVFTDKLIGRITTTGDVTLYPLPTSIRQPCWLLEGPDHAIWFTEMLGNKIGRAQAAFDPASSPFGNGPVVFAWRTSGDAQHRLSRPTTMATDKNSDLHIVDGTNHRIQKFSGEGTFLTTWGSEGQGDGQFKFRRGSDHPGGIAVDPQGTVLVVDDNGRVQEFDGEGVFLRKVGRWNGDG